MPVEAVFRPDLVAFPDFVSVGTLHRCRRVSKTLRDQAVQALEALPDILAIGGADFSTSSSLLKVQESNEALNLATLQWHAVPSLPLPRTNFASALLPDGRVFVGGGVFRGRSEEKDEEEDEDEDEEEEDEDEDEDEEEEDDDDDDEEDEDEDLDEDEVEDDEVDCMGAQR